MSVGKSLAIAAILSLPGVPALAQEVIYEPGYCAFYYPNANCQNNAPGNPLDRSHRHSLAGTGVAAGQTAAAAPRTRVHRRAKRPQ